MIYADEIIARDRFRKTGIKVLPSYGVCPIMEQGILGCPIGVYEKRLDAAQVALQNSNDDISFGVKEIPMFSRPKSFD